MCVGVGVCVRYRSTERKQSERQNERENERESKRHIEGGIKIERVSVCVFELIQSSCCVLCVCAYVSESDGKKDTLKETRDK